MYGARPGCFQEYLKELTVRRDEISAELLRLENRIYKLEESDLLRHLESGNVVIGFSRHEPNESTHSMVNTPGELMFFSNSSTTTITACELSERAQKSQKRKKKKKRTSTVGTRTVHGSSSDTDPETVGIAGLEAAATRDAELRAAHKQQYEAKHHMKTRSQT
ncbi:hypothetical protein RB195_011863 [Necator americanus]